MRAEPETRRGLGPAPLRMLVAPLACESDDERNLAAHLEALDEAAAASCPLALFPDRSLTGSGPALRIGRDLGALGDAEAAALFASVEHPGIAELVAATQRKGVAALFGLEVQAPDGALRGARVYAYQGRVLGLQLDGEAPRGAGVEGSGLRFGALAFGAAGASSAGGSDGPALSDATSQSRLGGDGEALVVFGATAGTVSSGCAGIRWSAFRAYWSGPGIEAIRERARRSGRFIALVAAGAPKRLGWQPGTAALLTPSGEVAVAGDGAIVAEAPLDYEVTPVRKAARVLVVDCSARALLVRFADRLGQSWWAAPGGGLEAGEDHQSAARRELVEELGRSDLVLGPAIGRRRHTLRLESGRWMTQEEAWWLSRRATFEVAAEHLERLVAEQVVELRWWSAEELRRAGAVCVPRMLPELIEAVAAGRLPEADADLGW